MERERLAGLLTKTRHDVEHSRRRSGLGGELRQADRRERRLLGGLQHHRVAGEECRPELPAADDERIVPRHDRGHDPQGLAAYERQVVGPGGGDLVVELVGELGVVLDAVGAVGNVDAD